jgi:hypothetical protein
MPLARYGALSALLVLAALWRARCGYADADFARSTAACAVSRATGACGQQAQPGCVAPHVVRAVLPARVGAALGDVGPALLWLPLLGLAHAVLQPRAAAAATASAAARHGHLHVRSAVVLAAACYLSVIMPVRFLRRVLPFDPSGHALLFGVQLVPLWAAADVTAHAPTGELGGGAPAVAGGAPRGAQRARLAARALAAGLLVVEGAYALLTLATAAWVHHAAEVAATWAAVGALAHATHALLQRHPHASAAQLRRWWALAAAAWLAGAALPLSLLLLQPDTKVRAGPLAAAVVYDCAVAAAGSWLLRAQQREGAADGAAGASVHMSPRAPQAPGSPSGLPAGDHGPVPPAELRSRSRSNA